MFKFPSNLTEPVANESQMTVPSTNKSSAPATAIGVKQARPPQKQQQQDFSKEKLAMIVRVQAAWKARVIRRAFHQHRAMLKVRLSCDLG